MLSPRHMWRGSRAQSFHYGTHVPTEIQTPHVDSSHLAMPYPVSALEPPWDHSVSHPHTVARQIWAIKPGPGSLSGHDVPLRFRVPHVGSSHLVVPSQLVLWRLCTGYSACASPLPWRWSRAQSCSGQYSWLMLRGVPKGPSVAPPWPPQVSAAVFATA